MVVDDFCPGGIKTDIARQHREADRLLRAQGNRSSRQRMRADSTLRPQKPPRGLMVSTGEDTPRGHSLRARLLILDVAPGMLDWGTLTACQEDAAAGIYAQALAGYVQWLAPRYGAIVQGLPAERRTLRQLCLHDGHRRTPDIIANLALGAPYFLVYTYDCGALTLEECRTYWERTWRALGNVAAAQTEHHAGEEPVGRFVALLSTALTAGLAHVAEASIRIGPPGIPEHWGWRSHEQVVGEDTKTVWQPLGACIGWLHGDRLYLDPEAAFSVVQRLADSQQAPLPITQQTLWKRMHEQCLLRRETSQHKNQVRKTIGGKREYVVDIPALSVQETGPSGPAGPQAAQAQQTHQLTLDLFPPWYQRKPVHSETAQSVHNSPPQSPPAWTDCASATEPVFDRESVHTTAPQHAQNQRTGPEGPPGPEMDRIESIRASAPSVNNRGHGECRRCGADQMTLVQRHGQAACVAYSLLSDDALARMRPQMPTNGTHAPGPELLLKGQTRAQMTRATQHMHSAHSVSDAGACPTPGCPGRLKTTGKGASAAVFCVICKYRDYIRTGPPSSATDEFDEGVIV
jgi:hypothetical protein